FAGSALKATVPVRPPRTPGTGPQLRGRESPQTIDTSPRISINRRIGIQEALAWRCCAEEEEEAWTASIAGADWRWFAARRDGAARDERRFRAGDRGAARVPDCPRRDSASL